MTGMNVYNGRSEEQTLQDIRDFHEQGKQIWFEKLKRQGRIAQCIDCGAPLLKLHFQTKKTKQIAKRFKWVELGDEPWMAKYYHFFFRRQAKHREHRCAKRSDKG